MQGGWCQAQPPTAPVPLLSQGSRPSGGSRRSRLCPDEELSAEFKLSSRRTGLRRKQKAEDILFTATARLIYVWAQRLEHFQLVSVTTRMHAMRAEAGDAMLPKAWQHNFTSSPPT